MKLFLFTLLFTAALQAQWITGAGYQKKSSLPENGAAFYLIKKLPYQSASLGLNLKTKINYFFSRESYNIYTSEVTNQYQEISADVFAEVVFFTGMFQPFAEIGIGGGYITGDAYKKGFFSVSGGGGLKLFQGFQPFLEIQVRQAFPNLDPGTGLDIKSFQIAGILGVMFNL